MTLDERARTAIRGVVRELDPAQISVSRKLTPAQRFAKMTSMIQWAERTRVYRLRKKRPELSETECLRIVRGRNERQAGSP